MTIRLGVLVSGRGTNLQAILDAIARGDLDATVALVVSNHAGVPALDRARRHGAPTAVYERAAFSSRLAQQTAMLEAFTAAGVDLVVNAGFDRILVPEFVAAFAGRLINVHPSLLPALGGGLHAQRDALEYGVKITGCTVHFVTDAVDAGPIILQAAVPVLDDDTE
ncbi:MAG: phosphoribosylglycinamide formyltransferase, partial [Chloroflexi bacterium]|nr:phosphoribosylglycinamide formyltransferase [Chloroflexota bacterium]